MYFTDSMRGCNALTEKDSVRLAFESLLSGVSFLIFSSFLLFYFYCPTIFIRESAPLDTG